MAQAGQPTTDRLGMATQVQEAALIHVPEASPV